MVDVKLDRKAVAYNLFYVTSYEDVQHFEHPDMAVA